MKLGLVGETMLPDGTAFVGCPMTLVGDDVHEFFELALLADKGHLPEEGGVNHQTESFLSALLQYHRENAAWDAELRKRT